LQKTPFWKEKKGRRDGFGQEEGARGNIPKGERGKTGNELFLLLPSVTGGMGGGEEKLDVIKTGKGV